MTDVVFWTLAPLLVTCALGVVLSRNLYRAAYWLEQVALLEFANREAGHLATPRG